MSRMTLDWSKLSPEQFELLCYHILESIGYANVEWYGKGGSDRGRDIRCQKVIEHLPGKQSVTHWLVQCKHYKNPIPIHDLEDSISWAKAHKPTTHFLLMTTSIVTSSTRDWLEKIKEDLPFEVFLIEGPQLETLVKENVSKLQQYLPDSVYTVITLGQVSNHETTSIENMLGLRQLPTNMTYKEQIFQNTIIPPGTNCSTDIYGSRVVVEQDCVINSNIYAQREIIINKGVVVKGALVSPGNIELCDCELNDVCGSPVTIQNACTIKGALLTDRDLYIPPNSKISAVYCGGNSLEIGQKAAVDRVVCKGTAVVGTENTIDRLNCSDLKIGHRCSINDVTSKGNVVVPNGSAIGSIVTDGSVRIEKDAQVKKVIALGDLELYSTTDLQEVICRNLNADTQVAVQNLSAMGSVTIRGIGAQYIGKCIVADGDVMLPNESTVEILYCKGDVSLGKKCRIDFLITGNLRAVNYLECKDIRCSGSAELGENCKVESLQAIGNISFESGLRSDSWTIFSKKGTITGSGTVELCDSIVSLEAIIENGTGSLLTSLTSKEQLALFDEILSKKRDKV